MRQIAWVAMVARVAKVIGVSTMVGIVTPCALGAVPADYPTRPIRLVVASTPGGSPDTIARVVGRAAENYLGQSFIVDNRGGANGIIGAQIVAAAATDGYTLLHTAPAVLLNALVHKKLPYDVERDLLPVTQIAAGVGYLMLVNPSSPVHTVKEFIALAKQKSLRYGAPPVGGAPPGWRANCSMCMRACNCATFPIAAVTNQLPR